MNRFALPLTLVLVALGVLVMAQFIGLPQNAVAEVIAVPPTEPAPVEQNGRIIDFDARSGLVDYREIDRRIESLMEDPAMVGLAVAVMENGEIVFASGYGETVNASNDPVTLDTVFRWASLSKGVSATMVALLAHDGTVDLSAPISRYAPSLRLPGSGQMRASVADILSHRLGIERNNLDNRLEAGEDPHLLRTALGGRPSVCPPGTCHRYQNIGFDAASELVEGVTDTSFEAAVRRRLLVPLGMETATISRRGLFESASWAHSHDGNAEEIATVEPYYRIPAAGGVNGSIRDLARWMQVQVGGAPNIVPAEVLALTQSARVRTEREDRRNSRYAGRISNSQYGLGWRIYDYAGHRMIAHRGAVRGYRAVIMIDPATRSGVVALWNSNTGRPFGIPMDIFDRLYGLPDAQWIESGGPGGAPGTGRTAPAQPPMIEGRRRPGESFRSDAAS
ncbi:serine hydrolase domain-containing protein [Parasphingopyxis marina]|uniref:Beta-lactamase family protein n=1 Tax=Parasphingopyxis marina TaxID=2761622 RepID=A0A842HUY6_9SPHN|nr:serine hydrolase domain-containing protein [Parasphingopyxis marina]MBC2776876.1 beta-lactamase family protein [Parasphingopyxis marina]